MVEEVGAVLRRGQTELDELDMDRGHAQWAAGADSARAGAARGHTSFGGDGAYGGGRRFGSAGRTSFPPGAPLFLYHPFFTLALLGCFISSKPRFHHRPT